MEDDDNEKGNLDKSNTDIWYYDLNVLLKNEWQLISIPLTQLKDGNLKGDGKLTSPFTQRN